MGKGACKGSIGAMGGISFGVKKEGGVDRRRGETGCINITIEDHLQKMIMKLAFIVLMMRLIRSWQKFKRTLSLSWRYKMIQTFRWYNFKDYADGDASKQKKERKKGAQSTVHLFILDTCLSSRQNRNAPAQFITATLLFLPYYCFLNFQC